MENDSSHASHHWCKLSCCNTLQNLLTILSTLPNAPLYSVISATSKVITYPHRGNKDWIQAYLFS